jgi:hypothetical protein
VANARAVTTNATQLALNNSVFLIAVSMEKGVNNYSEMIWLIT